MKNKESRNTPLIKEGVEKVFEGLELVMSGVARDTDRLAVLDAINAARRLRSRFYNTKYTPITRV